MSLLSLLQRLLWHHRFRSLLALTGFSLATILFLSQLGLLNAIRQVSVKLYQQFDFDLVILSKDYQFLYNAPPFDKIRLLQAMADKEVIAQAGVNIAIQRWTNPKTQKQSSLMLVGIERKADFIQSAAIRHSLSALDNHHFVLLDRLSAADYGSKILGQQAQVGQNKVWVKGFFDLGMFFYAEGSAIVSNRGFYAITRQNARKVSIGLLKVAAGIEPLQVKKRLQTILPDDVQVLTKTQLLQQEQDYFIKIKPLGILLNIGMLTALSVALVILLKTVFSQLHNYRQQYALLKAMGFSHFFIYRLAFMQFAALAVGAWLLALFASQVLFSLINQKIPISLQIDSVMLLASLLIIIFLLLAMLFLLVYRIHYQDTVSLLVK